MHSSPKKQHVTERHMLGVNRPIVVAVNRSIVWTYVGVNGPIVVLFS